MLACMEYFRKYPEACEKEFDSFIEPRISKAKAKPKNKLSMYGRYASYTKALEAYNAKPSDDNIKALQEVYSRLKKDYMIRWKCKNAEGQTILYTRAYSPLVAEQTIRKAFDLVNQTKPKTEAEFDKILNSIIITGYGN